MQMESTNYFAQDGCNDESAIVVVLGDVGRSPRMCYHALSLARHGVDVELVGYLDTKLHKRILSHPRIKLVGVPPPSDVISHLFQPLSLFLKFLWLFCASFFVLLFKTDGNASIILVQNPPGIPTLMICWLAARWKGAKYYIDWHNYTFSMLHANYSQSLGFRANLMATMVRFSSWWEGYWGRHAHWNLCVSQAMRQDMCKRWRLQALTVYDKSPSWMFKPTTVKDQHVFLLKLLAEPTFSFLAMNKSSHGENVGDEQCDNKVKAEVFNDQQLSTCFTRYDNDQKQVELLPARPALLVSSTSWSPDEDFSILLEALKEYERHANAQMDDESDENRLPELMVVITGKGPLRDKYAEKFNCFRGPKVYVALVWLAAEDYPKILGIADLGISLHTSTSGLDLPMKVIDMFGCHLPVLAKRFKAIGELVEDGKNGALFDTSKDLSKTMMDALKGFPNKNFKLKLWKSYFGSHLRAQCWEQQWDATLWPLIDVDMHRRAIKSIIAPDSDDEDED